MNKIAVIGGGAWGCALASAILKKGYYPFILTSSTKRAEQINNEFLSRFKNLESRNELIAHSDPLKVFGNASIIILATEVNRVLSFINEINNYSEENCHVLIASKGFGPNGELLSNILQKSISNKKIGVLSGPSFAQEVLDNKPTAVVVAGELETIEKSTELFHTPEFRVYGSNDIIGTSVSGAMKNVIAIAAGIVYGLELGENARAAILTRGLAETAKLAKGLGGQTETVFGLAGAGDMALSSLSMTSRNFSWGFSLAKKQPFDDKLTEGLNSSKMAIKIAKKIKIEMPITELVSKADKKNFDLQTEVENMMKRPPKLEWL